MLDVNIPTPALLARRDGAARQNERRMGAMCWGKLEATSGIEPEYADLQSAA
tara:strand:- start:34948 stop:35103 length:156 start_codon:yes stop_codon:yes gene_type:complete